MSNPIRVATAALSGQIFAGRPTKDGLGFKEPRYDVTSDVLKAVVDKIGIGFQTDIVSDGEVVCTIKIVGPDHPAAPSADKLRSAVEALEPFAQAGRDLYPDDADTMRPAVVQAVHFRAAAKALAALKAEV